MEHKDGPEEMLEMVAGPEFTPSRGMPKHDTKEVPVERERGDDTK